MNAVKNGVAAVLLGLGMVCLGSFSQAAQVGEFIPQGFSAEVESIQVTFDEPMAPLGDARWPAPFDVRCSAASIQGAGRWLDERRWTYVFDGRLDAGVTCTATLRDGVRSLQGEALAGEHTFRFDTGGPQVQDVRPYTNAIDEDQVFALRFSGPVDPDSVVAHSHCAVAGLGEQVAVRRITGDDRADLLSALSLDRPEDDRRVELLQCARRLPPQARVQLVVGPGVVSAATPDVKLSSANPDVFRFEVRPDFTASLTCGRENARAACLPVSPLHVRFTAPISRQDAAAIRLSTPDSVREPDFDDDESGADVQWVRFDPPFPAASQLRLDVPAHLHDDAGRRLANAATFPLDVQIADWPPLVRFPSGSFGVIERFGGRSLPGLADVPPTVPLAVRQVESSLLTRDLQLSVGQLRDGRIQTDVDVLYWYGRLRRLQEGTWTAGQIDAILRGKSINYSDRGEMIDVRGVPLLDDGPDVRRLDLPGVDSDGAWRPSELIGVPLPEPGFHVLEVESPRLGQSLLADGEPMYVRTAALVTNLGVHLKLGRDDALVWVTTLDDGKVVPAAQVTVLDCAGRRVADGMTDENGLWHYMGALDPYAYCEETGLSGVYASARIPADHPQAHGQEDFSFVLSGWNDGIESWRFNVPVDMFSDSLRVTHTILDRTLFRAGETVSMKHILRSLTRDGFGTDIDKLPQRASVTHEGSGERHELDIDWQHTPTGGLWAQSRFDIAPTAALGRYRVQLEGDGPHWYEPTYFEVDAFRLPVFTGSMQIVQDAPDASPVVIAPDQVDVDLQLAWMSGGPASRLPVTLSALAEPDWLDFPDFPAYAFQPSWRGEDGDADDDESSTRIFLDKAAVQLDEQGGFRLRLDSLPAVTRAQRWLLEASFMDPSGEVQTLTHAVAVRPAAVQAGIRVEDWAQTGRGIPTDVIALNTLGEPVADAVVAVRAVRHVMYSTRKRLVGGFYSYDNWTERQDLGVLCEGRSDEDGRFDCVGQVDGSGLVELIATVQDAQGRVSSAATEVWISGDDASWFGGHDDDRMDVVAGRTQWKPGETAEFQVRMPFRRATVLVTVEREGVLHAEVRQLDSADPVVRLPVRAEWGPNAYVSVFALRGRLGQLDWRGLWTEVAHDSPDWRQTVRQVVQTVRGAGTHIDLAKPAFRLGIAPMRITDDADRLDVQVKTGQLRYQTGDHVDVDIAVRLPDGQPAAHGTVAFAAVDKALLELSPNPTWALLEAMRQTQPYGVSTATAQQHVVGRRHYGRKAVPAGGGGGKSPTREILDSLLVWEPDIHLDEDGRGRLRVPLNDAISSFVLVAVADHGPQLFGTGQAEIVTARDLHVIPGLPEVVRQGDRYQAGLTVRNMTDRDMSVAIAARAQTESEPGGDDALLPVQWPEETHEIAAGQAITVSRTIEVAQLRDDRADAAVIRWQFSAHEQAESDKPAADVLSWTQTVVPRIPVQTQQSVMMVLDDARASVSVPLAPPADSIVDSQGELTGGVSIQAGSAPQPDMEGLSRWFEDRAWGGLEQTFSRAVALQDQDQWLRFIQALPDHIDEDGLLRYFPGPWPGNELLTAYVLTATAQARDLGLPFALPERLRDAMLDGLRAFAQGRIERYRWSPVQDQDARRLSALAALAHYGQIQVDMLESLRIQPQQWPSSALIDWMDILGAVRDWPQAKSLQAELHAIVRSRMLMRGTSLIFPATAQNSSPWLMSPVAANQARLILASLGQPQWDRDRSWLVEGLMMQQSGGQWGSSNANLLALLALQAVAQKEQAGAPRGELQVLSDGRLLESLSWPEPDHGPAPAGIQRTFSWAGLGIRTGADSVELTLKREGTGQTWLTLSSLAAVEPVAASVSELSLKRELEPVSRLRPDQWSVGDVYRVRLEINARAPMAWVALRDALPPGAQVLGSGRGRDSKLAVAAAQRDQAQENDGAFRYDAEPAYVERRAGNYYAYYDFLPAGVTRLEYVVRLSTSGEFHLPPVRVESSYDPAVYAELPLADAFRVEPAGQP